MSRRARRPAPRPRAVTPARREPFALDSLPSDLQSVMRQVLTEAEQQRVKALAAGGRAEDADLKRVTDLLAQHPNLVRWLYRMETMAFAREAAAQGGDPLDTVLGLAAESPRTPRIGAAGSLRMDVSTPTPGELYTRASPTGRVTGDGGRYDPKRGNHDPRPNAEGVSYSGVLRMYSHDDPWVRAAINRRRTQVGRARLACIPMNPLKPYSRTLQRQVQRLLDAPNEARQNRRELLEAVVEDIITLDRGCLSKNMTLERRPTALYAEDGATIRIYTGWSGNPNEPRYLYVDPANNSSIPLRNDQIIMFISNPASYRTGLSILQSLKETVEADLKATRSAAHMVDMKPPPGVIQFPGAQKNQIDDIRNSYDRDVAGRKNLWFVGGDEPIHLEKLIYSAKDNQWLEWQDYIRTKIAICFKMPPSLLGADFHASEGDALANTSMFADEGQLELMALIEEYLNMELLGDFAPQDDRGFPDLGSLNLKIIFPEVGEINRQMHAERAAAIAAQGLTQLPSFTLNQVLAMRGEQLVPHGNTFYVNTSLGPVPWLSYDGDVANYNNLPGMAGLADSEGGSGGASDDGSNANVTINGPRPQQPGKPRGTDSNPQQPPKKPSSAPTPGDARRQPGQTAAGWTPDLRRQQHDLDVRRVYDGRLPGTYWSPTTQSLDALSEED